MSGFEADESTGGRAPLEPVLSSIERGRSESCGLEADESTGGRAPLELF